MGDSSGTGSNAIICYLCKRKFASREHLVLHEQSSDMHQQKIRELGGVPAAKRRKEMGEGSAAGAKSGVCAPSTVVIWDLDETLILFNSLLNGQYTQQAASIGDKGNQPVELATALERLAEEIEVEMQHAAVGTL